METAPPTLFATELWDSFDNLVKHSGKEIQFCKDLVKFFKKRAQIEEEYGKELIKLSEMVDHSTITIGTISHTWSSMCTQASTVGNLHKAVGSKLVEKTLNTCNTMIKDLESKRKIFTDEGNHLNTQKSKLIETLEKLKKEFEKSSREAESAELLYNQKKEDPNTKQRDLTHLEKDMQKKKTKAIQSRQDYKRKVSEVNTWLEEYYSTKMPKVLTEFEKLSSIRIHLLKTNMKRYYQILADFPGTLAQSLEGLQESLQKIDPTQDIDQVVKEYRTGLSIPEPFQFQEYEHGKLQPPTGGFLQSFTGTLLKGAALFDHDTQELPDVPHTKVEEPHNVLGKPLDVLLEEDQKLTQDPTLKIPKILSELGAGIRESEKSEGIFRISAAVSDLKEMADKAHERDYAAVKKFDIHTQCGFLKQFLRKLPQPLIVESAYEKATSEPTACGQVIESLPEINQAVATFVLELIIDLLPFENVTRMGTENLALVFSPSFLRCPSKDPSIIMSAAEKEKQFMVEAVHYYQNMKQSKKEPEKLKQLKGFTAKSTKPRIGFASDIQEQRSKVLPSHPETSRRGAMIGRHQRNE